jgi:hypothetical protein
MCRIHVTVTMAWYLLVGAEGSAVAIACESSRGRAPHFNGNISRVIIIPKYSRLQIIFAAKL